MTPSPDAYLKSGYAGQVRARYRPDGQVAANGKFRLALGQLLYHSGKLSVQASGLIQISPNPARVALHPDDLKALGMQEGQRVRLSTPHGSVTIAVQADYSVGRGVCFFPEHFNRPAMKDLMPVDVDPTTGVPYFKLASVTLEKA
jgi:formate dehydrogenase (NADP+) alpha subunit